MMTRSRHHIDIFAIVATLALLPACAVEELPELRSGDHAPIILQSSLALTRGTQDEQLLAGQTVLVWANKMQTADGGTTWTTSWADDPYIQAWQLTADGAGALSGDTYYYTDNPLTIMSVHGRITSPAITPATSGTPGTSIPGTITHTVASDQSAVADFAASDLTWWADDNGGNGYRASSLAIAMQMSHKLSKIEIILDASGSDYTADELARATVRLAGIRPSVTLNMSTATSGSIGVASGTPVDITPYSPAANQYEAIIPPQASHLGVITISLDGYTIPVTPDDPDPAFASNTRYRYTITLRNQQALVTTSITPWDATVEADLGGKNIPAPDIRKLPLWYVAERNVEFDGSSAYSWASTAQGGYYFSWQDAMQAFTTQANTSAASAAGLSAYYNGSGSRMPGWHLPVLGEWLSIVPGNQTSIWAFDIGSGTYMASNTTVAFGYDATTRAGISEASYWKRAGSNEMHALRFLGTDYCSAWKYVWADHQLTISATLIENVPADEYVSARWYAANFGGLYFGNDNAKGAVQRSFYVSGIRQSGSGSSASGVTEYEVNGRYQCATRDGDNIQTFAFNDVTAYATSTPGVAYGRPLRLFRDSHEYVAPKTTIATATTADLAVGDIVCSDGTIYDSADASYVGATHKTPIGIIAFVNDGSAIGDAATEKGLGRYSTKSQGRALVICLRNSSNSAQWRTTNTAFGTIYTNTDASFTTATFYPGWQRTHDMNNPDFPAAYSAYNYSALAAPSNTTGWFLPSSGQWKLMISRLTPFQALKQDGPWSYNVNHAYTSQYLAALMDAYLAKGGEYDAIRIVDSTEYFYWTSSEQSSDYASRIDMPKDGTLGFNMLRTSRTYSYYVRPVLAF